MSDVSEGLQRDILAVQRVLIVITVSVDLRNFKCFTFEFQFDGLALADRFLNFPGQPEGVIFLGLLEFLPVGDILLDDYLQRHRVGAVDEANE